MTKAVAFLLALLLLTGCFTFKTSLLPETQPTPWLSLPPLPEKMELPLPAPIEPIQLERERILKADANYCRERYEKIQKGEPQ